jgi:hypothetical protein
MKIIDLHNKGKECVAVAGNLGELTSKFFIYESDDFILGWNWGCKVCGTVHCFSADFQCQTSQKWITYKIKCMKCGNSWRARAVEMVQDPDGTWREK